MDIFSEIFVLLAFWLWIVFWLGVILLLPLFLLGLLARLTVGRPIQSPSTVRPVEEHYHPYHEPTER